MSAAAASGTFRVEANGLWFHGLAAGPDDGPLVLLLHGFPEFSWGWRHQIGPLAAAGFRVVAVDQRGYGGTDKPPGVGSYRLDVLADDAAALVAALGHTDAVLVGHDWGGIVAWWTAVRHPHAVRRLVILNAPHPAVLPGFLLSDPWQLLKSWYVAFFQLPGVPEWLLARRDFEALRASMRNSALPGAFSREELSRYQEAWAAPGALSAMLNWYRAIWFPRQDADPAIVQPTLILWGDQDRFLKPGLAEASVRLCGDGEIRHFPGATHWLQHEFPAEVNAALLAFAR